MTLAAFFWVCLLCVLLTSNQHNRPWEGRGSGEEKRELGIFFVWCVAGAWSSCCDAPALRCIIERRTCGLRAAKAVGCPPRAPTRADSSLLSQLLSHMSARSNTSQRRLFSAVISVNTVECQPCCQWLGLPSESVTELSQRCGTALCAHHLFPHCCCAGAVSM